MEVEVLTVEGVPGDIIISAQVGTAPRRQARVSELRSGGVPLRLGVARVGGIHEGVVRLELLQLLGTARVVLQPRGEAGCYTLPFHGTHAELTIAVSQLVGADEQPSAPESDRDRALALLQRPPSIGNRRARSGVDVAAESYAQKHRLVPLMRALLRTVVRERPARPFLFLAQQFHAAAPSRSFGPSGAGSRSHRPSTTGRAGQGAAEIDVLSLRGAPSSAVLSVAAWKSCQQVPVLELDERGVAFRFPAGPAGLNPVRFDLLQPLGSTQLHMETWEASIRSVQMSGGGQITLALHKAGDQERGVPVRHELCSDCVWPSCLASCSMPHFQAAVRSATEYLESHGVPCVMHALLRNLLREQPFDPHKTMAEWFRKHAASAFANAESGVGRGAAGGFNACGRIGCRDDQAGAVSEQTVNQAVLVRDSRGDGTRYITDYPADSISEAQSSGTCICNPVPELEPADLSQPTTCMSKPGIPLTDAQSDSTSSQALSQRSVGKVLDACLADTDGGASCAVPTFGIAARPHEGIIGNSFPCGAPANASGEVVVRPPRADAGSVPRGPRIGFSDAGCTPGADIEASRPSPDGSILAHVLRSPADAQSCSSASTVEGFVQELATPAAEKGSSDSALRLGMHEHHNVPSESRAEDCVNRSSGVRACAAHGHTHDPVGSGASVLCAEPASWDAQSRPLSPRSTTLHLAAEARARDASPGDSTRSSAVGQHVGMTASGPPSRRSPRSAEAAALGGKVADQRAVYHGRWGQACSVASTAGMSRLQPTSPPLTPRLSHFMPGIGTALHPSVALTPRLSTFMPVALQSRGVRVAQPSKLSATGDDSGYATPRLSQFMPASPESH